MIEFRKRWWCSVEASIMGWSKAFHSALFAITRHMRESEGGDVACCGSFLPKFVSQLPDCNEPISDQFAKSLNKVLKTVVRGTRLMLREAAELQLGLCGVNLTQTAITSFFKPTARKVTHRRKISWTENTVAVASNNCKKASGKIKSDPAIAKKNKDLKVEHIFSNVFSDGRIYWEFKAG